MAIYLSGTTALEFWFSERKNSYHPYRTLLETLQHTFESNYERTRVRSIGNADSCDDEVLRALPESLGHLAKPLHLLVANNASRRPSSLKVCHTWSGSVPRGAFVRVGPSAYVSSPAFCFVQLAPRLGLLDLIQLGNEVCGCYAPSDFDQMGLRRCCPLTTVEEILSFAQRASWAKGSAKAMRAGKQVAYGLASPMETAQHMILCLPRRLGGQGIAGPRVNHRIDMKLAVQARLDGDHCLCDLYWPDAKLAVEYNGELAHLDQGRDIERENRLTSIGITTIAVTKNQLLDTERTDVLARQIRKHLGIREHGERLDAAWRKRAAELRKAVLPPNPLAIERVLAVA